jgi:TonB family protein
VLPPPAAAQGRLFEPTEVSEAPRIATRVEPDVPEDLRSRARNEIVIVRMVVSQSGRPSRVSLLRRSKAGPRLDDAVVAAVNQWTFSPAKRRGEAVSSWFNIGVPVTAN